MTKTPVILDCDPGIDDAVALALAFSARDELELLAVTTVAGNAPLVKTQRNARMLRELAGREDVPVYAGCPAPTLRDAVFAPEFHGEEGLIGIEIFEPSAGLGEGHAALRIVDLVRQSPEPVQLLVTGPLTNVAAALTLAPEITGNISELVIMGGADTEGGNITPHAEFNIFADPHAAKIVFEKPFETGLPVTVFSLDFTHTVRNTLERIDAVRASGGRLSHDTASLLEAINKIEKREVGSDFGPLHDPCTVAYALAPDLFACRTGSVEIVIDDEEKFGHTAFRQAERGVKWISHQQDPSVSDAIYDLIVERLGQNG